MGRFSATFCLISLDVAALPSYALIDDDVIAKCRYSARREGDCERGREEEEKFSKHQRGADSDVAVGSLPTLVFREYTNTHISVQTPHDVHVSVHLVPCVPAHIFAV